MPRDVWALVKAQEFEAACVAADAEAAATQSLLALRNKVFALLMLRRFSEAADACLRVIDARNGDTDTDFIFLGVAYWLSDCQAEAIDAWTRALDAKYCDEAGGVEAPLLQLYAGLKVGDKKLGQTAMSKLRRRTKSTRIAMWPGPIAELFTGRIQEAGLLARVTQEPVLRARQLCQAEFWIGVKLLQQGDMESSRPAMKRASENGGVRMLHQEYYLALRELRLL